MSKFLRINASQPMHTDAGWFLGKLLWKGIDRALLTRPHGWPNEGPIHLLRFDATLDEVKAFQEIILEQWGSVCGAKEFVQHIQAQVDTPHYVYH